MLIPFNDFKILFLVIFCVFLPIISSASFALTNDAYQFDSAQEQKHFKTFITEIRCLVCQNENIADSRASLAQALRQKIYDMMRDHQSDAAIRDYLTKRYGETILLKPRFNSLTLFLWIFPLLGLMVSIWFVIRARI